MYSVLVKIQYSCRSAASRASLLTLPSRAAFDTPRFPGEGFRPASKNLLPRHNTYRIRYGSPKWTCATISKYSRIPCMTQIYLQTCCAHGRGQTPSSVRTFPRGEKTGRLRSHTRITLVYGKSRSVCAISENVRICEFQNARLFGGNKVWLLRRLVLSLASDWRRERQ